MADITLTYKGNTIAELSESGNKTIETAGKYCEADILLEYVKGATNPTIKHTGIIETEKNSYNIIQQLGAKVIYKRSIVTLTVLSESVAVGGGAYTNNNYSIVHDGTQILNSWFSQKQGRVTPSSIAFKLIDSNLYACERPTVSADGSFGYRIPTETIYFPVGSMCIITETPLFLSNGDYDLTLFNGG